MVIDSKRYPSDPLNVWIVEVSDFLPVLDAGQRLLRAGMLATALTNAGHHVHWWTSTFNHQRKRQRFDATTCVELNPRLTAHLLWGPGYKRNRSIARLRHNRTVAAGFASKAPAALMIRRPDVVVAHFPTMETTDVAIRFARENGVPTLVDVRDQQPDFIVGATPRPLRPFARIALIPAFGRARRIFKGATGITGVSKSNVDWGLRKAMRKCSPFDACFPLGYPRDVSVEDFDNRVLQGLHILPHQLVVTFVGTFVRTFDFGTVLDAATYLAERGILDIQIVLAGDGDQLSWVRARAAKLPNVALTGWCDQPTVARLLSVSHVGLAPYTRDARITLPNKPIEYMAAGLPLLTSLKGELEKLVADEQIGTNYEPGDSVGLTHALVSFLRNPSERGEMGARARKLFESRFTAETIYADFAAHVAFVASAHTGR